MSSHLSRRGFLAAGLSLAAGAVVQTPDHARTPLPTAPPEGGLTFPSPELTSYVDEMPVPPVLTGDRTLAVAASSHRFHRDLGTAPTWSYGGQEYLGPTLEAHTGQPIALTFDHSLGAHLFAADVDPSLDGVSEEDRTKPRLSVHLHGAVTRPEMDGHPEDTFLPGSSMAYRHENGQQATNLWYHDHAMGITRLNVVAGLAGMYFLRDEYDTGTADNTLGLPSGEFEVPLILADRRFHDDGSLNFRTVRYVPQGHWEGGMIGDRMTVNGMVSPYFRVARGRYRFRVLNASNVRGYHLSFTNRMSFWVVANDGGLLDTAVRTTAVRVTPGERIDLVVDFSGLDAGETVELTNDQEEAVSVRAATGAEVLRDLVRFVGTGAHGDTGSLPARLRGGARQPAALPAVQAPTRTRVVSLTQSPAQTWPPVSMGLNNLCYGQDPMVTPKQGTTELWEVVNSSLEDHPIHLHLVNMRILNRQTFDVASYLRAYPRPEQGTFWAPSADRFLVGQPQAPAAWEAGPKDTIRCPQNMVTRFVVRFPTADELGFDPDAVFRAPSGMDLQGYVWHCHIIDHEDQCMMARYRLVSA
jgi:FtsP/CotA-like multicopper oxidase with cupredoxin domain